MFWKCPKLLCYWTGVTGIIDQAFGAFTKLEAKHCLLGLVEGVGIPGGWQVAVMRCLFQARNLIARRWQSVLPLSSEEWLNSMNVIILKEKAVHIKQGALRKYEMFWKSWWEARGIDL